MSIRFAKLTIAASTILLLSFSTNSIAGGVYGNVGYGHHPIHVVIGYNGHGRDYGHSRNNYRHHNDHKRNYRQNRHHYYNKHAYNYGHSNRHHYNQPRKYCRSGY